VPSAAAILPSVPIGTSVSGESVVCLNQLYGRVKSPWPESASKLYRPSDRRLLAKLVPTFADRGYHVVSVTDPYGRILGFLGRQMSTRRTKIIFLGSRCGRCLRLTTLLPSVSRLSRQCVSTRLHGIKSPYLDQSVHLARFQKAGYLVAEQDGSRTAHSKAFSFPGIPNEFSVEKFLGNHHH
jgi:hypothetical protein